MAESLAKSREVDIQRIRAEARARGLDRVDRYLETIDPKRLAALKERSSRKDDAEQRVFQYVME